MMRKLSKLFILIITMVFVLTLGSCAKGSHSEAVKETVEAGTVVAPTELDEKLTFIGYYSFNKETKTGTLYLTGSVIPQGEYEAVTIETAKKVDKNGVYSFPQFGHRRDGFYFAGWYQTDGFVNGQRITTSTTAVADADKIIYAKYITLGDSALVSLVCVTIVFGMLALLWGIVALFKFIPSKKEEAKAAKAAQPVVAPQPQKAFTLADITDDDMMAAALVATIDYHNETNEDVRVVSVKQIG